MMTPEQMVSNPLVTLVLVVLGGFVASKIGMFLINGVIRKLTEKTKTTLDDEILAAISTPVQAGIIVLGVYIAMKVMERFSGYAKYIDTVSYLVAVFFITWLVSRLTGAFLKWYGDKMDAAEGARGAGFLSKQILPFSGRILSVLIFLTGIIIALSSLGVEIAPLLGSLGIAGLAVALALQDTLSNFFAGLYFLFDKPIRVGDFLTLGEGSPPLEGFVEEIGWRNTKIGIPNMGVTIIPNMKLAQSTFTNRSLHGNDFASSVRVTVRYDSDLDKVESLLLETANKVLKDHPEAVKDRPATVMLSDFEDFAVAFKVLYTARSYAKRGAVENALRHAIFAAFREAGIETPFPTRLIINKA